MASRQDMKKKLDNRNISSNEIIEYVVERKIL